MISAKYCILCSLMCLSFWPVATRAAPVEPTLESYSDAQRTVVENNFSSPETVAYLKGINFKKNASYDIAYYDGSGSKIALDVVTSDNNGVLLSQYVLNSNINAVPGEWHALVQSSNEHNKFGTATYAEIIATPHTYGLVASDDFYVNASSVPEISSIITGIALTGLCSSIYLNRRRRKV